MTDKLAARWGRYRVFWVGGAGMACAAAALTVGGAAPVTIAAAFVMGFIGTWTLIMVQATFG